MGIREYFKQHPDEQDLKLSGLTLKESKSKDEIFDPLREIGESDLQEIKNSIMGIKIVNSLEARFDIAELFPDYADQVNTENEKSILQRELRNIIGIRQLFFASRIKDLYPEFDFNFALNKEDEKDMLFQLIQKRERDSEYLNYVLFIKKYYSKLFEEKISGDKYEKSRLADNVKHFLGDVRLGQHVSWFDAVKLMSIMKRLYPDDFKQTELNDKDWLKIREAFNKYRDSH